MEDYRLIEAEEYLEDLENEDEEEEEELEEDEDEEEESEEDEEVEEVGNLIARVIPISSIEEDEDYEDEYDDEDGDYWDEDEDLDEDYWDDDDYEDEDFEDEDEEVEVEELIPVEITSHNVSIPISDGRSFEGPLTMNNSLQHDPNELESSEGKESLNRGEIDGLFCPICFEAWTSGGSHQICCLPCGHIYGFSCITKWLQLRRSSGKCPQCKGLCTLKDVRVLYAARLCVADEELQKKVRSLEAKCAYLEQKDFVDRIKEELREELKRDMDEKLEKLKREMVEKMEKLERDMEEIRMVNMFDEFVRNQNQQQNVNDQKNDLDPISGTG